MVVTREPQVLIKEARRRTRHRRVVVAGWLATVVGSGVAIVLLLTAGGSRPHASAGRRAGLTRASPTIARLKSPGALAVSPGGTLYVIDGDRVLRLLPSGGFAVFAGDGRAGFSVDGGPATHAQLSGPSALAVAADGTVFIADTGNNRVRAVAPDGTIRTVLRIASPRGLALGPGDRLYISASNLYSLSLLNGRLRKLAGWSFAPRKGAITNREIMESHFSEADGLAVDAHGDVFEANFPQLYERTADGRLRFLGNGFRAGGAPGQLTEGPRGAVYGGTLGVARISTAGPDADQVMARPRSIIPARRVDAAVGGDWRGLAAAHNGAIVAPAAGLAVAGDGTVYYDSESGDGWASGALIEVAPSGGVRVLWRAPH